MQRGKDVDSHADVAGTSAKRALQYVPFDEFRTFDDVLVTTLHATFSKCQREHQGQAWLLENRK